MPEKRRYDPQGATRTQTEGFTCPFRTGATTHVIAWIDNINNSANFNNSTNPMIDVLCIDPGVTTGYAFGQIDETEGVMRVTTGQERWTPGDLMLVLQTMLPDILIYEDFQYRNRARAGLELFSVQLIGVINLYGQMHPECKLVPQQPATAIGQFYSNTKLKEAQLYKSTSGQHANDACRHLLQWYTFRGGSKFNKRGFSPA